MVRALRPAQPWVSNGAEPRARLPWCPRRAAKAALAHWPRRTKRGGRAMRAASTWPDISGDRHEGPATAVRARTTVDDTRQLASQTPTTSMHDHAFTPDAHALRAQPCKTVQQARRRGQDDRTATTTQPRRNRDATTTNRAQPRRNRITITTQPRDNHDATIQVHDVDRTLSINY